MNQKICVASFPTCQAVLSAPVPNNMLSGSGSFQRIYQCLPDISTTLSDEAAGNFSFSIFAMRTSPSVCVDRGLCSCAVTAVWGGGDEFSRQYHFCKLAASIKLKLDPLKCTAGTAKGVFTWLLRRRRSADTTALFKLRLQANIVKTEAQLDQGAFVKHTPVT